MVQNSIVPRSQEDYITQVSEEIEGRVIENLSQEFSKTENRILGELARLDDFLMNPLLQSHSGTTPETSRNVFSINQGTNEDDSESDPHPEAGLLTSGREDCHDMAMGLQRRRECIWPRHGDRSYRTYSQSPGHGDWSSRRSHLLLP